MPSVAASGDGSGSRPSPRVEKFGTMAGDLIIIGAGATGREIADVVSDINRHARTWNLLGFLDDDAAKQNNTINGLKVLGTINAAMQYEAHFLIGIAVSRDMGRRRKIVNQLGLPLERYATLIHPSARVSPSTILGRGTILMQNVVVTSNAVIGDHVIIQYGVAIAHDGIIEDFSTIAPGAIVAGTVRIGQGAYLGAGSMIKNGLTIGEGALVGIGAVVVSNVPADTTVIGNPARPLPTPKRA